MSREPRRVERDEMFEEVVPEVELDLSADAVEYLAHRVAEKPGEGSNGNDVSRCFQELARRHAGSKPIYRDAQEPRNYAGDGRRKDHQREAGDQFSPVWGIV